MRRLFVVFAKLLGLLQIYWALLTFVQIGFVFTMFDHSGSNQSGQILASLIGTFLYFAMALGMAWLLLVRTEWLANKLKIQADDQLPTLSDDTILHAGIKVVGIYILVNAIPILMQTVFLATTQDMRGYSFSPAWTNVISSVLQVILALPLIIRTHDVIRLIAKGENTQGKRIIVVGLALLAVVIFLARGLAAHPWFSCGTDFSSDSVLNSYSSRYTVTIPKDTNISAASTMNLVPYPQKQAMTNTFSQFTTASVADVIKFLNDAETAHTAASNIQKDASEK